MQHIDLHVEKPEINFPIDRLDRLRMLTSIMLLDELCDYFEVLDAFKGLSGVEKILHLFVKDGIFFLILRRISSKLVHNFE